MDPELLNWLKRRGAVGLLIVALWIFRDHISFTFRFDQPQARREVTFVEGDEPRDDTQARLPPTSP